MVFEHMVESVKFSNTKTKNIFVLLESASRLTNQDIFSFACRSCSYRKLIEQRFQFESCQLQFQKLSNKKFQRPSNQKFYRLLSKPRNSGSFSGFQFLRHSPSELTNQLSSDSSSRNLLATDPRPQTLTSKLSLQMQVNFSGGNPELSLRH